ncbi:type II secretion system F family protein [Nonomuraea sp. NBC_00507]|uniref:type II secretion system F family protein n=1 Tax=Nonomuraea sp. NBC_00507 TaxID=2976002 RepID=UPI002E16EBBE
MTALLAALAGAALIGGLVALVVGVVGRTPRPGLPPSPLAERLRRLAAPHLRRRLLIAAGMGVIVLALTRWPVAGIGAGIGTMTLPALLSGRSSRAVIDRMDALERWTRRLSDVLAAGRGLEHALMSGTRNAPDPIAAEVRALGRRVEMRVELGEALRLFADDLNDPIGDRIAAALILAAERRGQGLRQVLTGLAGMVATEVANRRQIEAERAQCRTTVRWITVFLIAFTGFAVLSRDYVAPYSTLVGQLVLAAVLAMYAAGLRWIHRLGATNTLSGRFLSDGNPEGKREGR